MGCGCSNTRASVPLSFFAWVVAGTPQTSTLPQAAAAHRQLGHTCLIGLPTRKQQPRARPVQPQLHRQLAAGVLEAVALVDHQVAPAQPAWRLVMAVEEVVGWLVGRLVGRMVADCLACLANHSLPGFPLMCSPLSCVHQHAWLRYPPAEPRPVQLAHQVLIGGEEHVEGRAWAFAPLGRHLQEWVL